MTKRKIQFSKNPEEPGDERPEHKSRRFKENHSLDSDEEEEKKTGVSQANIGGGESEANVLHEDDIEGQEDETIREDDGIKVTPFNLKDEMEEGHFDAQGNFIADKNDEDVTDGWLDSVDWNKVPSKLPQKMEEDEQPVEKVNQVSLKKEMVAIMKPGENVLKTLRRLGGNKKPASSADRWKKKKANAKDEPLTEEEKQQKTLLLKLTELADNLLTDGDFQIYEKTYEKLNHEIKETTGQFEDAEEDNDEDDELEAAFKGTTTETKAPKKESNPVDTSQEVHWFYKKTNDEGSELKGPFSSTQMLKWQESGKFGEGVYCRRVNQEGNFYNSKRIDFDLYT